MREMLGNGNAHTAILLRTTDTGGEPEAWGVIWEHGRRNFMLRAAGKLRIVCPRRDARGG